MRSFKAFLLELDQNKSMCYLVSYKSDIVTLVDPSYKLTKKDEKSFLSWWRYDLHQFEEGTIAAAYLIPDGAGTGNLENVFLVPSRRRKGYGTLFYDLIEQKYEIKLHQSPNVERNSELGNLFWKNRNETK